MRRYRIEILAAVLLVSAFFAVLAVGTTHADTVSVHRKLIPGQRVVVKVPKGAQVAFRVGGLRRPLGGCDYETWANGAAWIQYRRPRCGKTIKVRVVGGSRRFNLRLKVSPPPPPPPPPPFQVGDCLGEWDAQKAAADYVGANDAFKLAGKPVEFGIPGGTGGIFDATQGCRDAPYETYCTRLSPLQVECAGEWLKHTTGLETPNPVDDARQRCRRNVVVTLGPDGRVTVVAGGEQCFETTYWDGRTIPGVVAGV